MAREKLQKRFVDEGFGFPVVLLNVPMVKVREIWTPKIDYNKLAKSVALALAAKPARLTGNEIRFIRQHFEMTLSDFGARFDVTHPAVVKWEGAGEKPPKLKWPVEKDIRLFILDREHERPMAFGRLYKALGEKAAVSGKPLEINATEAA